MESSLDQLPLGCCARITSVEWSLLDAEEGRRLRELGFLHGVELELLHRGSLFVRDPLAVRLGRMQVVIRTKQAAAIRVIRLTSLQPETVAKMVAKPAPVAKLEQMEETTAAI